MGELLRSSSNYPPESHSPNMTHVESSANLLYLPHQLDNPQNRIHLLANEASIDAVGRVYDAEGSWILRGEDDYPNIWEADPGLLERALIAETKPIYDLVDNNLLGEKWPHGYNRHDLEHHVLYVKESVDYLLHASDHTRDDVVRTSKVASIGHDLGNLVDRKGHADKSPLILETIMPSVLRSKREWAVAREAIELHDEKALRKLIDSWGNKTREEDIMQLRSKGPVLPALVLADKGDIGRHRTNPWARNAETIDGDEHMWVNYLAEGKGYKLSRDRRTLTLSIAFNPTISTEEYADFTEVATERDSEDHKGEYKAKVPPVIHDAYQDHNVPHFYVWGPKLMNIYLDRFQLSALCAGALFPRLEKFVISLQDGDDTTLNKTIHYNGKLNEQFRKLDMLHRGRLVKGASHSESGSGSVVFQEA